MRRAKVQGHLYPCCSRRPFDAPAAVLPLRQAIYDMGIDVMLVNRKFFTPNVYIRNHFGGPGFFI
jgi:hypothetical protein